VAHVIENTVRGARDETDRPAAEAARVKCLTYIGREGRPLNSIEDRKPETQVVDRIDRGRTASKRII
jgi:hypothetical protein